MATQVCSHCHVPFSKSDVFGYLIRLEDNRIYCGACLEKSYVINAYKTPGSKIMRFFLGWLWLIGAVAGFMVIETSLKNAPHQVISIAHFTMAFLGAMLGLGISKAAKEIVIYFTSDISKINE